MSTPINNSWFRLTKTDGVPSYSPNSVVWGVRYIAVDINTKIWYEYNPTLKKWEVTDLIPNGTSIPGKDGREIELRNNGTSVEWRYKDDPSWTQLIPLSSITGPKGDKGDPGVKGDTGQQGLKGDPGQAATISVGQVNTLPPGQPASVTNSGTSSNAVFNFWIPRGQDGVSSGGNSSFVSPSQFSGDDASKLEQCIASGKPISLDSNLNINRPVNFQKTRSTGLVIYGNFYKIKSTTSFDGYLLGRPSPTDLNDAVTMMNYPVAIYNLQVEGFPNQTGIDFGATYGAWYENIYCYNLKVGLHLKFALQTTVNNLRTWYCETGSIADWYQGFSWATVHNSQSNLTVYRSPRLYSTNPNAIGIAMYSCDGGTIYDMVVEGTTAKNCVVWDAMGANTVKKFSLKGLHVECVSGLTGEAIKLNSPGGFADISDVIGHYADMMVSGTSTAGVLVVSVKNVGWWVMKNGKAFSNSNCGWVLSNLSQNIINPNNLNTSVQAAFSGTVPAPVTGAVTGYNQFKYMY
jgi:hypothetical protein